MTLTDTYNLAREQLSKTFDKIRQTRTDVNYINGFFSLLNDSNTMVALTHQTNVMKKYTLTFGDSLYRTTVEYAGTLVKLDNREFDIDGYIGIKLNKLHKKLQKRAGLYKPLCKRIMERFDKEREY